MPIVPAHSNEFGACRALILDPHLNSRRLLHDILADLHCGRVTSFGQPEDAWEALDKGGFNIFFIDWSEDQDAIGLLRQLRSPDSLERFVPAVVIASYSGVEDVTRARDAGANEFILRPYSAEVVARHLRALARLPRPFVEAGNFFGPDRRRHRQQWAGQERRRQAAGRADRRRGADPDYRGPERRLGPAVPGIPLQARRTMPTLQRRGLDWNIV